MTTRTGAAFPDGFLWAAATAAHQVEGTNVNNNAPTVGRIAVDRATFVRSPKPSLGRLGEATRRNAVTPGS